jgi:UDP-N-acetylmuramoyl-L-alanyl-D-glutamate--2,6-diaminopimelate ligase
MAHALDVEALVASLPADLVLQFAPAASGTQPLVDVTHDSRQVQIGWVFVCVVGGRDDGHRHAPAAVAAGAALLVVERLLELDVAQLVVADARRAMGPVAAAVHGHPASKLQMIGVTGTNGKTTTTHLLAAILRAQGTETRLQGTLSGTRTTPESSDLQRMLATAVDEGVEAVVMEVSSHALALHRVSGTRFDAGVFTNLGRDHLDLHESMEAYFRAKASLFTPGMIEVGVTNFDDPHGRLLLDAATVPMVGYGRDDIDDLVVSIGHSTFTWRGQHVVVPLGGHFNVMNALAALTTATVLGIDAAAAAAGIATAGIVPGRFELVSPAGHPFAVVVDYAHTPDGLVEVLTTARQVIDGGRVIVVFGCGGDRDAEKRPLMGAAAASHADRVFVTSDNPRHEDPLAIIDAAVAGVESRFRQALTIEADRRAAIEAAIAWAAAGDIVVIAGKGHETTQTIGDDQVEFDDRQVARHALEQRS